jgi:hypothetical protein
MKRPDLARLCAAVVLAAPTALYAQADSRGAATAAQPVQQAVVGGDAAGAPVSAGTNGPTTGTTAFTSAPAASATGPIIGRGPHAVVRAGEHIAAPFLDRRGGPAGAGVVLGSSEISAVPIVTPRSPFQLGEDVYIKLPAGAAGAVGDKFYTYSLGPESEQYGQIVIPTGLVKVERAAGPGEATVVRVVDQFEEMDIHQGVLPMDSPTMPAPGSTPTPVTDGWTSHVVYVDDDVVMPSIAFYVVVPIGEHDAVKLGDLLALYRPVKTDYETGLKFPEEPIATAQVVRIADRSVTAVITQYKNPDIKVGTKARLAARMP